MNQNEAFLKRLVEAITKGDAKQVRIAEFCNVSEQAVARWKKTGQISRDNLLALSEISGYRYLYILNGELPKRIESTNKNRQDYMVNENATVYYAHSVSQETTELDRLIEALKLAHSNKSLSEAAILHLTNFIKTLNSQR